MESIDCIFVEVAREEVLLNLLTRYKPIIELLTLLFVIVYVIKTASMARSSHDSVRISSKILDEMKAQREAETRPHIIAYFEVQLHSFLVEIVVKNIGRTVATNVKLAFTPPLRSSFEEDFSGHSWVSEGLGSMPPGKEIRTFFDISHNLFGKVELPKSYQVKVDYSGGVNDSHYSDTQLMDLNPYKNISSITRHSIHDLVKEVKTLVKHEKDMATALKDIKSRLHEGLTIKTNLNYAALSSSGTSIENLEHKLREVESFLSFIVEAEKNTVYTYGVNEVNAKMRYYIDHLEVLRSFVSNQLSSQQNESLLQIINAMRTFCTDRIPTGSDFIDRFKEPLKRITDLISQFFGSC